jgi:branched-chain amino acid transport system permease protein
VSALLRLRPTRRQMLVTAAGVGVAVVAMLLANLPFGAQHGWLLPRKAPAGILLLGLVFGAVNSMVAIGVVLVYRGGNYINFAQGSTGAAGVVLTAKLIQIFALNWVLAACFGIALAAVLAVLAELLLFQVGGLFRAPRLIVTVATLGLVQLLGAVELILRNWQGKEHYGQLPEPHVPLGIHFSIGIVPFTGDHVLVLAVVPVVVVALLVLLRRTDFGASIQAAAENADRAELLGVSVRRVHTNLWLIAGLLSGLTAVLEVPLVGFSFGVQGGPGLFLLALTPAVAAGMGSIGGTLVAALGLGVVESVTLWNYSAGPLNAVLLGVLLVSFMVRRRSRSRGTEGEARSFAVASRVRPFPRELARVAWIRASRLGFRAALLLVAVLLPIGFDLQRQILAEEVVVFVIAGISLTLLTGYAGQVSFGQWALVGFGALFGGWLRANAQLDFFTGFLVVAVAGAGVAAITGLPALRIRGLFLGASTLAFALACIDTIFRLPFLTASAPVLRPALPGFDLRNELHYYWFCIAVLVTVMVCVGNLRRSRWGRNFLAVRDNDRAAQAFGVRVVRAKLLAFAASGMLAAIAGYLYVHSVQHVSPAFFSVDVSLLLFSAVVIGGLGSISGAVIGALYTMGVRYFIPVAEIQMLATSLGLLFVLLLLPGGVGSLFFEARDGMLRWVARRMGVVVPSLLADVRVEPVDPDGEPSADASPRPAMSRGVA